jgi:transcription elongation factor S-II
MTEYRNRVIETIQQSAPLDELHARDMEIGIYNWSIGFADKYKIPRTWKDRRFLEIYKNKARSVIANIDPSSYIQNNSLLNRLQKNEFKPHDVAFMRPEEMFPDKWNHLLDARLRKEEHIINSRQVAKTDMFRCGKCKKNECSYYELQVRSADEPTTIFITCLNCGNKWRMG